MQLHLSSPQFEAIHIFLFANEKQWNDTGYSSWITEVPATGSTINLVQNEIWLNNVIYTLFDEYEFSLNTDMNF